MNPELEDRPANPLPALSDASTDAESRLEMSREALRRRLEQEQEQEQGGDTLANIARLAGPIARQTVREHPYASLTAAALAGVWLVRRKPWQALGGSVLAGLLARQALSWSMTSGSRWLNRFTVSGEGPGKRPRT